jgi:hypothetical protein
MSFSEDFLNRVLPCGKPGVAPCDSPGVEELSEPLDRLAYSILVLADVMNNRLNDFTVTGEVIPGPLEYIGMALRDIADKE